MPVTSHFFVSVIAPLYNDADIVEAFIEEAIIALKSHYANYELVLIDDGSHDNTQILINEILKKYECIRYISLSRSFGMEEAISAGLDTVIGDVVVTIEPQCDPPELIPAMVEQVRKSNGIVFGVKRNSTYESLFYRFGKKVFYWFCRNTLKLLPPKNTTFFIGLTHQSLNAIIQIKNESKFIRIFGGFVGFKKQILEYEQKYRRNKPRGKSFFEGVSYAISIVIFNTSYPLKIISYLGLLASILNALYLGYLLFIAASRLRVVEGWLSSSFQISIMFLFVFVIFAVLSEYLARIVDETKQRPPYFIEEEKNSSVMYSDESRKNIMKESC